MSVTIRKTRMKLSIGFGTVYNLFLRANSKKPDRQTYNLLQALKNYVLFIDPVIDSPDFKARAGKKFSPLDLRAIPESQKGANEFASLLKKSAFSREQKRQIVRIFGDFRRKAVAGIHQTMQNPFADKEKVFRGIEQTSGLFLGTASDIASVCHGIGEQEARVLRTAFENFTNALQIYDDMKDALIDFGVCQNAVVSIAKEHQEEFSRLQEAVRTQAGKKLSKKWIQKNMPKTMAEATKYFEKYAANPQSGS